MEAITPNTTQMQDNNTPQNGSYLLVKVPLAHSRTGYTIAEYKDGQFICQFGKKDVKPISQGWQVVDAIALNPED